jgi:hypothetical protein
MRLALLMEMAIAVTMNQPVEKRITANIDNTNHIAGVAYNAVQKILESTAFTTRFSSELPDYLP